MTTPRIKFAYNLTTAGGDGSLDTYDGAILADGYIGMVVTDQLHPGVYSLYVYRLKASSGVSESLPQVIAPNARPAFAAVAIVSFLFRWAAYLWPLLVTSGPRVRPLPVAIAAFYTQPPLQWGDILAFGVMMVAPVLLVFLLFQRAFVRGVTGAAVKG